MQLYTVQLLKKYTGHFNTCVNDLLITKLLTLHILWLPCIFITGYRLIHVQGIHILPTQYIMLICIIKYLKTNQRLQDFSSLFHHNQYTGFVIKHIAYHVLLCLRFMTSVFVENISLFSCIFFNNNINKLKRRSANKEVKCIYQDR